METIANNTSFISVHHIKVNLKEVNNFQKWVLELNVNWMCSSNGLFANNRLWNLKLNVNGFLLSLRQCSLAVPCRDSLIAIRLGWQARIWFTENYIQPDFTVGRLRKWTSFGRDCLLLSSEGCDLTRKTVQNRLRKPPYSIVCVRVFIKKKKVKQR